MKRILLISLIFSQFQCLVLAQTIEEPVIYRIEGESKELLRAKMAMEMDSIRLIIEDEEKYKFNGFELLLYNDSKMVENLNFNSTVIPNVFSKYEIMYIEDSIEYLKDLTHFVVYLNLIDKEKGEEKIFPKAIYFSIIRTF